MYLLHNHIKEYAWGSFSALPTFLGMPSPASKPQAELWMGAHPLGSSHLFYEGEEVALGEFLAKRPEALGPGWRSLPFLLKILAVEKPLSLQAHPSLEQARKGHALEEALSLSPSLRNYKDVNHKPELLCALSPFEALVGFEKPDRLLSLFQILALPGLSLSPLSQQEESAALRAFFSFLLGFPHSKRKSLLTAAQYALPRLSQGPFAPKAALASRLLEEYPGDMGALASLCLNLLRLQPLEAVFVPAGCLHAYVHGMGVEIMANSDNVLRGGLSPKRVDVDALLSVLHFESARPPIQKAMPMPGEAWVFEAPVSEFSLSLLRISPQAPLAPRRFGPEILLLLEGEVATQGPAGGLRLGRGQSAFVSAAEGPYMLMGEGLLARATVPRLGPVPKSGRRRLLWLP